jgi:hypothetical protein
MLSNNEYLLFLKKKQEKNKYLPWGNQGMVLISDKPNADEKNLDSNYEPTNFTNEILQKYLNTP